MTLSDDELTRYARHIVLREIGGAGQLRLRAATVAVIGAGGIGSPAIQYLAAAGIGTLRLIDDDSIDLSNLQRQTIFTTADIGASKVGTAADRARAINPHISVLALSRRIDSDNAAELLAGVDCILDGSDNFDTRLAVADTALRLHIPLVSAAVSQFEGQMATYRGWEADKPCYRCFVGAAPDRPDASCSDVGVLGAMAGIIGNLGALEVIRSLVPFGEDSAGKLLIADALDLRFRTIRLPKDTGCIACG